MPGKPPLFFWSLRILGPMLLAWLGLIALDLAYSKVTPGFGIDPFRLAAVLYPAFYFDALAAWQDWRKTWRLWLFLWTLAVGYMVLLFAVAGGFGLGALLYGLIGIVIDLPDLQIAEGLEEFAWLVAEPHRTAFLTTIFLGLPPMGVLAGLLLGRRQLRVSPPASGRAREVMVANALGLAFALPGLAVFLPLFASALRPTEQILFGVLLAGLAFLPHLALTWRVYEVPAPASRKGRPPVVRKTRESLPYLGLMVVGWIVGGYLR